MPVAHSQCAYVSQVTGSSAHTTRVRRGSASTMMNSVEEGEEEEGEGVRVRTKRG